MFWSSPGQTYLIALYGGELRATLGLGHGEFGGLYSAATLCSAALLLYSGRLVDRVELPRLAMSLVPLLAASCWLMSYSAGAFSLALAFFLLRHTGQGLMSHVAATSMARYFDTARGRATAVASLGFALAEACLPALTLTLIAAFGWRDAWRLTGLAALLLLPAICWMLRGHARRHRRYLRGLRAPPAAAATARAARQWTRAVVLRDRRFYLVLPALLAPSVFFTGFFFHQTHLVAVKGWELGWWGALFGVYAGAALLAALASGAAVDRAGAARLLPLFPLPLALGLLLLSQSDAAMVAVLFLSLTGLTSGLAVTVTGPYWAETYGVLHLGAIRSLASALSVFGSALSPFALGLLFDLGLSLDALALASAVYILGACWLARVAVAAVRL